MFEWLVHAMNEELFLPDSLNQIMFTGATLAT